MPEPEVMICPECGLDLTDRDPWGHALSHWSAILTEQNSSYEARKRQKKLIDWAVEKGTYRPPM